MNPRHSFADSGEWLLRVIIYLIIFNVVGSTVVSLAVAHPVVLALVVAGMFAAVWMRR